MSVVIFISVSDMVHMGIIKRNQFLHRVVQYTLLLPRPSVPCILLVPAAFSPGRCVALPFIFIIMPLTLSPIDVFLLGTPFLDVLLERAAFVFLTRGDLECVLVVCELPLRRCRRDGLRPVAWAPLGWVVVVVVVVTDWPWGWWERVKTPILMV